MSELLPLYGRTTIARFGKQGTTGWEFRSESAIGRPANGHRLDFSVRGGRDGSPRRGALTIYNPPKDAAQAMLEAGTEGFFSISGGFGAAEPLFSGIPIRDGVRLSREGDGSLVLKLEGLAGGARLQRANVSISLAGAVTAQQAIEAICAQTGHAVGRLDVDTAVAYPRGFVFSGRGRDALRDVALATGSLLHYHGTGVELLQPNAAPEGELATKFSEAQGNLLARPHVTNRGMVFAGLLDGRVIPGRQVVVEYADLLTGEPISQRIVAQEVTFSGSSHGQKYQVSVAGRKVVA